MLRLLKNKLHVFYINMRELSILYYKGLGRNIDTITTEAIRNYVVFMKNEKIQFEDLNYKPDDYKTVDLSPSTINTRLKRLRLMFRKLIESNPMNRKKESPCLQSMNYNDY